MPSEPKMSLPDCEVELGAVEGLLSTPVSESSLPPPGWAPAGLVMVTELLG